MVDVIRKLFDVTLLNESRLEKIKENMRKEFGDAIIGVSSERYNAFVSRIVIQLDAENESDVVAKDGEPLFTYTCFVYELGGRIKLAAPIRYETKTAEPA